MSTNHFENLWYVLCNEGIKSAINFDYQETKNRHSNEFNTDGRYICGFDAAIEYISKSNRPLKYQSSAISMVKDLTRDGELYFPKHSGLKELIDAALAGRLERDNNTICIIVENNNINSYKAA